MQHAVIHCSTLHHTATGGCLRKICAATHCNTLQHTAIHGNTLQHIAIHCNTLHKTIKHAPHCTALHHTALHCNAPQRTAMHCNTLQHTATDLYLYNVMRVLSAACCSCCQKFSNVSLLLNTLHKMTIQLIFAKFYGCQLPAQWLLPANILKRQL